MQSELLNSKKVTYFLSCKTKLHATCNICNLCSKVVILHLQWITVHAEGEDRLPAASGGHLEDCNTLEWIREAFVIMLSHQKSGPACTVTLSQSKAFSTSLWFSHTFVQNDVILTDFKALITVFRPLFLNSKQKKNIGGQTWFLIIKYIIKNSNSGCLINSCMKAYHYKWTIVYKGTVMTPQQLHCTRLIPCTALSAVLKATGAQCGVPLTVRVHSILQPLGHKPDC